MITVVVSNASFDPRCRMCQKCRLKYDPITGECPGCGLPYDEMEPSWFVHLRLEDPDTYWGSGYTNVVRLSGPTMDVVMGMTITDYLRLCERWGDLSTLVVKYFHGATFSMTRSVDKVLTISLPPGCQLNFRNWLGLQPGFSAQAITETVLNTIEEIELESDGEPDLIDELNEKQAITNFFMKQEQV